MAECKRLAACPFFNDKMAHLPSTGELFKKHYCRAEFAQCARYQVAEKLGKEKVPIDLYPNETERAQEILKKE